MTLHRFGGLLVVIALLSSCHQDEDAKGSLVSSLNVGESWADPFGQPPLGLTWFIRFTENVSAAQMTTWYGNMQTLSDTLWEVSEGQIYIRQVWISDGQAPGALASKGLPGDLTTGSDMVVYPAANWNILPILGYVQIPPGREGRIIAVPDNATADTLLHEASHLVFRLGWEPGPLLTDEYADDDYTVLPALNVDNPGCIMEDPSLLVTPAWCHDGLFMVTATHVAQPSQPHACWTQILADYPNFVYAGNDSTLLASPTVAVVYNDLP